MKRNLWLAAAFILAAAIGVLAHAKDDPTIYGKRMLQVHSLPAEALARFESHDSKLRAQGKKPGFMTGGSEDWAAPELSAPSAGNPYRLVVRVAGTVLADGDAGSMWMAGWNDGNGVRSVPVTGATRAGAKAGERIELIGASGPVSFKEDRTRQPALSFLGTNNFRIDDVKLEVWAGVGNSTFAQRVWAWSPLLVGVVFLGLFFWFRRG